MGVMVKTKLNPFDLLLKLKNIEQKMGRLPKKKDTYEDRLIDLDILVFENFKLNQKELIIPHPKIQERRFSLLILKDIYGDKYISDLNNTAENMLKLCCDHSNVVVFENGL
jgi:2-amino-4-hydroxy-6-hydroxymethyldihydropteridine diphosphokinase